MKRFFTAMASALSFTTFAAPETKIVDPKTLYYSVATINDELPAINPTLKPLKPS